MDDGHEHTAIATRDEGAKVLESVILKGDISALTPTERVQYYKAVCDSVGLNPLTQPFAYMSLSGKSVLYAKKDATDQLRKIHGVSVVPRSLRAERIEDVYVVMVDMIDKEGRTDSASGAVTVGTLKGDALANALMKAETKAKRRCTLSLCGLGLLDETELDTIPDKKPLQISDEAKAQVAETEQAVHVMFSKDNQPRETIYADYEHKIMTLPTKAESQAQYKAACTDNRLTVDQKTVLGDKFNERFTKK